MESTAVLAPMLNCSFLRNRKILLSIKIQQQQGLTRSRVKCGKHMRSSNQFHDKQIPKVIKCRVAKRDDSTAQASVQELCIDRNLRPEIAIESEPPETTTTDDGGLMGEWRWERGES
ncbi:hypothetical protein C2S51_001787 [Perilla frutescens var. frutescens]|nr:hypothetical protein C2S51_001787 [Perilla frutescens var. frutescens]